MFPFLCRHNVQFVRIVSSHPLLWPALQLKAAGQKSPIFVVGLLLVRCKRGRSLLLLPCGGLLDDPVVILLWRCLLGLL